MGYERVRQNNRMTVVCVGVISRAFVGESGVSKFRGFAGGVRIV